LRSWSFLTHHAEVLLHIGRRPESTGLEIAQAVGVTERSARAMLRDLEDAGYIEREKIGRRNRYHVDVHRPVTSFDGQHLSVGQILQLLEREAL
jgi:DNA-binding IclR family transcriptional regulator